MEGGAIKSIVLLLMLRLLILSMLPDNRCSFRLHCSRVSWAVLIWNQRCQEDLRGRSRQSLARCRKVCSRQRVVRLCSTMSYPCWLHNPGLLKHCTSGCLVNWSRTYTTCHNTINSRNQSCQEDLRDRR